MPIVFGTAGIPLSCPRPATSLDGIRFASSLGLGAFEFEFVRSARMAADNAAECGAEARRLGVVLSAHAPYFVNLCSIEPEKVEASRRRIVATMGIMHAAGGGRVVFHPAFYGKMSAKDAYAAVKSGLLEILDECKSSGFSLPVLAPETTGKRSAFGSLEELYALSSEIGFDRLKPTIDFAHLHARSNGGLKSVSDFENIFDQVESFVGKRGLAQLHCHFAGIRFSEKGELNHLTIDSKSPDFGLLAQALVSRKCGGVIISESPRIEADALLMKKEYESALAKTGK